MAAVFETSGMDDPLGLWTSTTPAAGTAPGAVSFAVGGDEPEPQPAEPVFRVNLPADSASAAQAMDAREQYIRSLDAALNNVPARLDGLVARTQERQQKAAQGGVSFDVSSAEETESGPESDLLALLDDAEAEEKAQSGEVSFGLQETASVALEQAKAGFEALTEQIGREVLHFAWVETTVADALLARTTIGWTGDAQTAFAHGVNDSQVMLHNRNLRIVTQTRNIRLRLFITIATGAAKVSALLTTPTGAVLALPAVYQYVMQIIAQVKQLQSIQSS
jgi:hypothetical protein